MDCENSRTDKHERVQTLNSILISLFFGAGVYLSKQNIQVIATILKYYFTYNTKPLLALKIAMVFCCFFQQEVDQRFSTGFFIRKANTI